MSLQSEAHSDNGSTTVKTILGNVGRIDVIVLVQESTIVPPRYRLQSNDSDDKS